MNDNTPWQWRRICFSFKGPVLPISDDGADFFLLPGNYFQERQQPGDTTVRLVDRLVNPLAGADIANLNAVILRGGQNLDYFDPMNAAKDTANIRFHYDKIYTINSGNEVGVMREYVCHHRIGHNVKYFDTEFGADTGSNGAAFQFLTGFSTQGKQGMGDYYVYDLFRPNSANTESSLVFGVESTLRWTEK